ncbi:phage tail protein [Microlunatus sp. Gsoil 973]|uniref:phage tail protein n=1 Tax=Microlunatus sp. Gsoil 973 TaxID=2672569 RepID=UPI0012B4F61B|nr:phage tail protein [Microlunatus sp. Gsoil 973]QGN34978.1 phage tail protein [Microlunatus sp. Gsoil 973]
MRGSVDGLSNPAPLADTLPAMLRADPFAAGLCQGLDEVLAPVMLSLDSFPAYLDLDTTPDDMLAWLGGWVGLISEEDELPAGGDPERLRSLLASAQQLHIRRGTRLGIERAVSAELDLRCEVLETGAASWAAEPDQPLPEGELSAEDVPTIEVVVYPSNGRTVDLPRLEDVLEAATPAHVRRRVRVMPADQDQP